MSKISGIFRHSAWNYHKHALVKIFSTTIHNVPELNTVLIRSKFRQRLNNRIFIPTVFRHRSVLDLNGIAIDDAHAMSLTNLKSTWDQKISDLRSGADRPIHRVAAIFKRLPSWLCRPAIKLVEFIQYTCNVSLGAFGLPNDRFGSMTITFLDKYDIMLLFHLFFSRSPITLAIGKTMKDGNKKIVPVTCTFDHRCFDGFEGSLGIKELKDFKSTSVTIGRPQHHRVINADVNQSVQHFHLSNAFSRNT